MPSLHRRRRAFWGDLRFLIGIALVVLSITAVWLIVTASDDAQPVLRAEHTITPGESLTSADFDVVEVSLGMSSSDYLGPDDLQAGQIATRTLSAGEIVPRSALTDADDDHHTTVVIDSSTGIPEEVDTGSVVDVWHAPPIDDGRAHEAPRILVAGATVRAVLESEGMLAGGESRLEIVIDRADAGDVLAAITGGSALSVLPVGAGS